ncbi:19965_t:CDS:2, partial [Funneliformis geosporum]
ARQNGIGKFQVETYPPLKPLVLFMDWQRLCKVNAKSPDHMLNIIWDEEMDDEMIDEDWERYIRGKIPNGNTNALTAMVAWRASRII